MEESYLDHGGELCSISMFLSLRFFIQFWFITVFYTILILVLWSAVRYLIGIKFYLCLMCEQCDCICGCMISFCTSNLLSDRLLLRVMRIDRYFSTGIRICLPAIRDWKCHNIISSLWFQLAILISSLVWIGYASLFWTLWFSSLHIRMLLAALVIGGFTYGLLLHVNAEEERGMEQWMFQKFPEMGWILFGLELEFRLFYYWANLTL